MGVSFQRGLQLYLKRDSNTKKTVPRCYPSKVFLKILQNSQEGTCSGVSFIIRLQLHQKICSGTVVFLRNFKFLRTSASERLLKKSWLCFERIHLSRLQMISLQWQWKTFSNDPEFQCDLLLINMQNKAFLVYENSFYTLYQFRICSINRLFR